MSTQVLVLPSPLLPAQAYASLVHAFRRLGAEAALAPGELDNDQGSADLIARWAALALPHHTLVAHSNAGYLAPTVRSHSRATAIVFMDSALPPGSGDTEVAPSWFREHLASLSDDDGMLPPWTRWWPREELDEVIPRDRFDDLDSRCPRLPLHYFDGRVSSPARWAQAPCAYLAFGTTYAAEIGFARTQGWPLESLDGGHLHFLHDPATVAATVLTLASRLAR